MAPLIRMKSKISGTRDGVDWPAPGETLEVPDAEAAQLVAGGQATLAGEPETADAPTAGVETATATVPGKSVAQVRAEAKAAAEAQEAADAKAKQEASDAQAAADESKGAKK